MNLIYLKKYICNRLKRSINLYKNDKIIGELSIEGIYGPNLDCFDSGNTCSLSISIVDEYQNNGYTKLMWKEMIKNLKKENIRKDQMFFIDVDASCGYWNHIGMIDNRYYERNRSVEGKGYEKVITFNCLEILFNK